MPQPDHNQEIELRSSRHESTNGHRDTITKVNLKLSEGNAVLEKTETTSHALRRYKDTDSKKYILPIDRLVTLFIDNGQQL